MNALIHCEMNWALNPENKAVSTPDMMAAMSKDMTNANKRLVYFFGIFMTLFFKVSSQSNYSIALRYLAV